MIGSVTEAQAQLADIEKRRKRKAERAGRDLRAEPDAVTDAHEAALGAREADEAGAAGKAFRDRGIAEGPAEGRQPGPAEPEDHQRGYLEAGHAARSPMAGPPRHNPMPEIARGYVTPVTLPDTPMAVAVPAHVTAHYSSGSPSERGAR